MKLRSKKDLTEREVIRRLLAKKLVERSPGMKPSLALEVAGQVLDRRDQQRREIRELAEARQRFHRTMASRAHVKPATSQLHRPV